MNCSLSRQLPALAGSVLLLLSSHSGAADYSAPLPDLGAAPELSALSGWLNSAPLTIASLRGKVVLVEFWTYACSSCVASMPYVSRWHSQFKSSGLALVGIHTPEFSFEKDAGNFATAVRRLAVEYPVAQDNQYATWAAFSNSYWPAIYLIDRKGHLRYRHFGEGKYQQSEQAIRQLLAEKWGPT